MSFKSIFSVLSAFLLLTVIGCEEELPMEAPATGNFTVTIENVFEEKEYLDSGTFIRIDSAENVSFVFNARIGQRLSMITSLNDSTDIFIATPSEGIALYDGGQQIDKNLTSDFELYDAGSDTINAVLAPVELLPAGTLPPLNTAMDVVITPLDNSTGFEVTVSNIREDTTLLKSISEGTWVVHDAGQMPFYELGAFAEQDLVDQAQFNINATFNDYLEENSGWFSSLSPGAYGFNDSLFFLKALATDSIESLAEDGDPSLFAKTFDTPIGATEPGMIGPGEAYSFSLDATAGDYFSMASMLVETNDWYVGVQAIPLFQNNKPLTGEITQNLRVYDAGTEVDEYPQLGPNQRTRQSGANVGPSEGAILVTESDESFKIPDIRKMIRVTLRAN